MLPAAPPRDAEHGARLPLLFGIGTLVLTALLARTLLTPTHVDAATVRLSVATWSRSGRSPRCCLRLEPSGATG